MSKRHDPDFEGHGIYVCDAADASVLFLQHN